MLFLEHNQLVSFHLLFQIAIFMGELHQGVSVTYHPSTDTCKGSQLENKCDNPGEQLARIKDSAGLDKAKLAIVIVNGALEYWTSLRYHKNKQFCWDKSDEDDCNELATLGPELNGSILDIANKGTWSQGWYCFSVSKDKAILEAKKCSQKTNPYICEKDNASSELSSAQPVTMVTMVAITRTEPTSTATPEVTTTNLPKLTTPIITTEILLTPSLTTTTTTATTTTTTAAAAVVVAVASTPVLTSSNTVIASSVLTTDIFMVKETLTSPGTASSLVAASTASTNKTTTKEKQTAEYQLRQYASAINSLNVSEESSLQDAANITGKLFRSLKEDQTEKNDVNILLATQQLEAFAISYGQVHYKANESKVISEELFAIKIQKISADNKDVIIFSVNETDYSTKEDRASISLPSGIFKGQEAVVVSILYNDIKQWIPDVKTKLKNLEMGSRIIASTVDPKLSGTLDENVIILFSHDKAVKKGDTPHCVFWDFTLKSELNGSWSSKGCSLKQRVDKEITCSCNHLTNFAVLMQVGDNKVSPDHRVALEVITYIGCGLSLAGELLTIIAYCALMNLKQEQVQIRFNLVVAIAIAQIVFLSGIDASETKGVCAFIAALIHYFYLAGFAWMLFEGVFLYLMVVKVFNTVVRMRLYYVFAWGFPLVMVLLSIAIASSQEGGVNSYVHGDFCWVSFNSNLIWTFAAPVLAVCLINSIILARVVYEIIKMQSDKTSELEKIRQGLKACAVLFPLLGTTWVFGILSVTDAGLVFQYIFTILNSLQGLFIFLIHVLRNSDVRAAFLRKKQKWKESRSISTSRVASQGADMLSNKQTCEESQELSYRRSGTPRSSTTGYANMSIAEPEGSLTPVQM